MSTLEYTGVRTTGIYCRPGCGGRPNAENTTAYRSAAAAEAAGLRACFQCRPYRVSDLEDWVDGPELVCRAVRLVIDGYLDAAHRDRAGRPHRGERPAPAAAVRRAGRGHPGPGGPLPPGPLRPPPAGRHRPEPHRHRLRRRVRQRAPVQPDDAGHVPGVAPGAAGPPPQGRPVGRRRRADAAPALRPAAGLGRRCWSGSAAGPSTGSRWSTATTYRRTIVVDGEPGVIEVSPGRRRPPAAAGPPPLLGRPDPRRPAGPADVRPRPRAHRRRASPTDPMLAGAVADAPGLRVPGSWDGFEVGVRAILGQQVTVTGARTLAGRLVQRAGDAGAGPGRAGPDPHLPVRRGGGRRPTSTAWA